MQTNVAGSIPLADVGTPVTFRVVMYTQIMENYGEPGNEYWKFKGGSEYHIPVSGPVSDSEAFELAAPYVSKVEHRGELYREFVVSIVCLSSLELTEEESMDSDPYMRHYLTEEQVVANKRRREWDWRQ